MINFKTSTVVDTSKAIMLSHCFLGFAYLPVYNHLLSCGLGFKFSQARNIFIMCLYVAFV